MKVFKFLKDLIAPKKCYSCNKEWCFLCNDCFLIQNLFWYKCFVCFKESYNWQVHDSCQSSDVYYDEVKILFRYKWHLIRDIIRDWKYNHRKDVFEDLWAICWKYFEKQFDKIDKNSIIVTSSPMHYFKRIIRWFNQADILGKLFSETIWFLYFSDLLKKNKTTKSQTKFSKDEREKNVLGVFTFNSNYSVAWKTVILIDDVITTWSTMNNMAKVLKENWAKKIILVAIASQ